MSAPVGVVTVDLGVRYLAAAAWRPRAAAGGVVWSLVAAGRLDRTEIRHDHLAAERLAQDLATWAYRLDGAGAELVIEVPTSYPDQPATERTLERMRATARTVTAPWRTVRRVEPRAWKANVPKEVHHARALAALTDTERRWWSETDHDVRDAIALGLWATERLSRGGAKKF